jgi:Na+-transporting NADH:ubiquinone oxidoreductase subunit NqrF
MVALQNVVLEHRNKLVKLEKVLAQINEDKEVATLQDVNVEEVERLRDALKDNMVSN